MGWLLVVLSFLASGSSCNLHSSVLVELRREAEINRKATNTVFVVVREGWGEFLICFLNRRFIME